MARKMEELAQQQPGYLGIESARDKIGITVSYWEVWKRLPTGKPTRTTFLRKAKGKPIGIHGIKCGYALWSGRMISALKIPSRGKCSIGISIRVFGYDIHRVV